MYYQNKNNVCPNLALSACGYIWYNFCSLNQACLDYLDTSMIRHDMSITGPAESRFVCQALDTYLRGIGLLLKAVQNPCVCVIVLVSLIINECNA